MLSVHSRIKLKILNLINFFLFWDQNLPLLFYVLELQTYALMVSFCFMQ